MFVRLICWPGQNGATFYAKNGRFWPFLLLYSYCNATRTQLIFKNVIYDITLKNKKNQASPSCLNFEKTTQKWPKMAIFAHFWLFLLQYSLFIATITDFMLNNVKITTLMRFLKNWLSASIWNLQKRAKNGRFWPFWVLFSYSNATRTQLIFKNVIYDITLKNKKNQASPSCLNFEKTTHKWPKMAIFAHFLLFLLQYSLFIGTIIDFMLNNVKYNYTDAFLKNWLSASTWNLQTRAKNGRFGYFFPILMRQELSWSSKMSFMTSLWKIKKIGPAQVA